MYDDSVATYCCEITASRELHFLGTIPTVVFEEDEACEKFLDNIMEGDTHTEEISYIHAEGYPAGELKHGPIALIDQGLPVVAIATASGVYEKMVSNIPKNEPIPTTNQNKTENTVDESPKIVTQPKIEKETVIQQPSPLNKLEIPKEKEEIKVPEEPIKVEEKSNFDPFSYYNFNSTEESSDVNNDTEEGESAVGQVDNEPENIESDENKIADEQNKDSFESEEEDKEDNIGIKNEEDKVGESALNTDNTDKKDVRIKKEVEIPANLPIVEEKPETTIPNQPIIEPKILEEAVKKEVEKVKTNPVVEETIKAIENVEQTPKESINLLDKSVAKSNVSEPETNKESGIEIITANSGSP
jgi:hypothetical protein